MLPPLLAASPATPMDQWRYHQLSAFVHALPKPLRDISDLTQIESAFTETHPVEKPISNFYQALQLLASTGCPTFLRNWEKDLHKELSETQKSTILHLSHTSSMSSKMAEVNYIWLTLWHYTLAVLHRTFPTDVPTLLAWLWRMCNTLIYSMVVLPALIGWPYFTGSKILGYEIANDPCIVLLHCTGKLVGSCKKKNDGSRPHLLYGGSYTLS